VGDSAYVFFSTNLSSPTLLAPFGLLELATMAPDTFGQLTLNTVPAYVPMPFSIPIPSDPALSGLQISFQVLVGKTDRLQLSNAQTLLIL
jgi:hypothetical protein